MCLTISVIMLGIQFVACCVQGYYVYKTFKELKNDE